MSRPLLADRNFRFYLALAVVTALGAFARFWELDLCFWFRDCADVYSRVLDFVENGHFPLRDMNTTMGAIRPPAFLLLISLPAFVRADPVFMTGFISLLGTAAVWLTGLTGRRLAGPRAGLLAATLMATSPWAVVMSRNLWPQCALPFFSSLLLWLAAEWLWRPRARTLVAGGLIATFAVQVHPGIAPGALALGFAIFCAWRRWRTSSARKAAALGLVALGAATLYAPYWTELYLIKRDPARAERYHSNNWLENHPVGQPPSRPEHQGRSQAFPSGVASTLHMHSAMNMEYWVGLSNPTMRVHLRLWKTYALLADLALLASLLGAFAAWRRRRTLSARGAFSILLALWLFAPAVGLCSYPVANYPHYFTAILPAGFLLMARQAEVLRRARRTVWIEKRFVFLLLACIAFGVVFLICIAGDLKGGGGFPDGDYGTAYRYIPR